MKRFRSTRRSMAGNGGLESDPKYFDHVSQPLNNVAKAATNNDRPAYIVTELRLFVLVIVQMLRTRGQVGKVNACTAREIGNSPGFNEGLQRANYT